MKKNSRLIVFFALLATVASCQKKELSELEILEKVAKLPETIALVAEGKKIVYQILAYDEDSHFFECIVQEDMDSHHVTLYRFLIHKKTGEVKMYDVLRDVYEGRSEEHMTK